MLRRLFVPPAPRSLPRSCPTVAFLAAARSLPLPALASPRRFAAAALRSLSSLVMSVPAASSTQATHHTAGGVSSLPLSLPPPLAFFGPPAEARIAELTAAAGRPPTLNEFLAAAKRTVQQSPADLAAAVDASTVRGTSGEKISVLRLVVVIGQADSDTSGSDSHELNQRQIGNEASDMDSMVSSIVLAWYLSCIYPFDRTAHYFLPLMNIPREELALRGEASYAFAQVGLDPSLLLFKDEIDLAVLGRRVALGAILVDHNNLSLEMEPHLAAHVVGVVDHHHDEGLYPVSYERDNRIIVTPMGSCTTLIGDLILRRAPALLSKAAFSPECDSLSMSTPLAILTLLQYVLLLDTSNFSATAKKAQKLDVAMSDKYKACMQDLTYYELQRRRNDVTHLSTRHMLVKDTKYGENQRYPHFIASLPCSLTDWAKRDPDILCNIESFARERHVRFIVVMNAYVDPVSHEYQRSISLFVLRDPLGLESKSAEQAQAIKQGELMASDPFVMAAPNVHVAAPPNAGPPLGDEALAQALVDSLVKDAKAREQLDVESDESMLPAEARGKKHKLIIHTFKQKNVAGSRKQVAPIVEALTSKL